MVLKGGIYVLVKADKIRFEFSQENLFNLRVRLGIDSYMWFPDQIQTTYRLW